MMHTFIKCYTCTYWTYGVVLVVLPFISSENVLVNVSRTEIVSFRTYISSKTILIHTFVVRFADW